MEGQAMFNHLDQPLQPLAATQTAPRPLPAWPRSAEVWSAAAWQALTRAGLRLGRRYWLRGVSAAREAATPAGPKIIALNHPNVTDAFVVPALFPDLLCGLIQADVFAVPLVGRLLVSTGQLPVNRTDGHALLAAAVHKLQAGYSLA